MLSRLTNSWHLALASARVLQADKELLVFPLISAVALMAASITFFIPTLFSGLFDAIAFGGGQFLGAVVLFVYYVVQYTVIIFFNTALVGAALIRLRGGDPTVRDGFEIALGNLPAILGYAVIAATVGAILRWISERSNTLGRLIVGLIGLAWNVATFLVVPILAAEGVGPLEAVKRSTAMLKRTWGEQIVGNLGLGAFFTLLYVAFGVVGAALAAFLVASGISIVFVIAWVLLLIVLFTLLGLVNSTLGGIYTAAVYQYASGEDAGEFFNPEVVRNAFRQRSEQRTGVSF